MIDAEDISRMIIRTLHETNAQDYEPHVIDALVSNFSPQRVVSLITNRQVYVAIAHGQIVGTASLNDSVVRTVFVDPNHQRKGISAKLMDVVESCARARSVGTLSVPSSVTAQGFYEKLGFVAVREELHGDERTIIMTKDLAPDAMRQRSVTHPRSSNRAADFRHQREIQLNCSLAVLEWRVQ
jgi:GNAT superfamily N-acetyltransferase